MQKTVCFDLDGTLLDTLQDLADAGNHTLTALGLPTHPVEDYAAMVGNGAAKLVERFLPEGHRGKATQEVALHLFRKWYGAHANDKTQPYPGIQDGLRRLKAEGWKIGILSNKPDDAVQDVVSHYFPGLVDVAIGMREEYPAKPDPASLYALMAELGASPTACVFCGDSDVDVQTAHNGGLPCVGVTWGFRSRECLQQAGVDVLVDDADALFKTLAMLLPDNENEPPYPMLPIST